MAANTSCAANECWEEVSLPPELKLSNVEKTIEGNDEEKKGNFSEQKTKELLSKKLCGYLEKLGDKGLIKTWKRRWFVYQARRCLLYYYRNPDDLSELGNINISEATFAMNISSGRMDQFDIRTPNRDYHLQAQDQQTALYWLQELQARRREYSTKITIMCHNSEVNVASPVISEPFEFSGLIAGVIDEKFQEEDTDDNTYDPIPAPETVGENAAKLSQESRPGLSYKSMKTGLKNLASKRYSMIPNSTSTEHPTEKLHRSSSLSDDLSKKRSSKIFSVGRLSSVCLQCKKLSLQLEACAGQLEELKECAQAREETITSLNEYIREVVLEKSSRDSLQTEPLLKDNNEKDKYIEKLENKLSVQTMELSNLKKDIAMLKEVISTKDEIVMRTTNELATVCGAEEEMNKSKAPTESNLQSSEKEIPFSSLGSSGESYRSFLNHIEDVETAEEKVCKLKEALRAYIVQNNFLNSEVLELNKLRKDDTERIRTYIAKNQTQEADLCRVKSKFYLLVQEVHAPVKDGQPGLPQEVISQLLEEAIEIETQSKKSDDGSKSSFDRYGFYTKLGDDDALVTVASKLNRRSDEIVKCCFNFYNRITGKNKPSLKWDNHIDNLCTKASANSDDVRQTSLQVKWENYMMTNGKKELQKTPELKNLVRSGIPYDLRGKMWLKFINSHVKSIKRVSGKGYYDRLLATNKDSFSPAVKQIGLDLLRTLPNNKYYDKQDAGGIDQLRRVLLAYSWHNPDVGYCQGLNRLAAIALLYLNEEDSFWALVALVEFVMPKDYYSSTLIASQCDQRVLKDILAEKTQRISEHLDKLKIDLSLVTFNWFLTAFVDSVPIEIVFRIWDSLLYEGTKILFRFALAIFRVNEGRILEIQDHMQMFTFLRNMTFQLTNDDQLYQVAFQGLNPFPMQKINSLREFHLAALKRELEQLDKVRREYVEAKVDRSELLVNDK